MKKRHLLLIAALVLIAALAIWALNADGLCLGTIENRTDDQWSQMHLFLNGEITVDFPIDRENQTCLFQYETGRGSFSVEITDASGNQVYSNSTDESGSASFQASSDLKIRIRGKGHGGMFSLLRRGKPSFYLGDSALNYGLRVDGNHSGGQFTATYQLRKADGQYVNFYVENKGSGPVVITVNGQYDRTIPAGSSGHICAPISASIMPQPMTVKCVTASGDDINIYWKIAQRTQNTT